MAPCRDATGGSATFRRPDRCQRRGLRTGSPARADASASSTQQRPGSVGPGIPQEHEHPRPPAGDPRNSSRHGLAFLTGDDR